MEEKEGDDKNKIEFVKWLSELDKNSGKIAGGKGANLAEMYNIKMPVPPAFVVTAQAYFYFIEKTGLREKISSMVKSIDTDNTKQLEETAKKIRELIIAQEVPDEMKEQIIEAYETLSFPDFSDVASSDALSILRTAKELIFVAVRSSATTEDLSEASFAGQQETFVNIKGNSELIEAVKKCFASLFTARAIYYRAKKGFENQEPLIAVIVQKMINSEKSGVIFTNDPVVNSDDIVIEAVFGLGEGIVSGAIKPDNYVLSRDLKLKEKIISEKKVAFVRTASGETKKLKLTEEKGRMQVLTDYEMKQLGSYGLELEEHYGKPQDIEFAIDRETYIVQTRPITTLALGKERREIQGKILLKGIPASQGIASGKVKIIKNLNELSKVSRGDVLVTEMTNPDMVVTMQKTAAIVTDEGGVTSHAAIVSREMGIPCVVGTKSATQTLQDNTFITVNGFTGTIYGGKAEKIEKEILPVVETKTKVKVIVDLPDFAERAAKTKCREVGLLRVEGIIASSGKHPLTYSKEKNTEQYSDLLFQGIEKISKFFDEIWIRTSDIRTDEFENLEGAPEKENNPMLGMHGIRASLKNPELLKAEISAIKKVTEEFPEKKFGIMFPQVISVEELQEAKKFLEDIKNANIKIGVMIETPASVQVIQELCEDGIDFISFGTNDLTQFTLAIDRNNENVQYLYDEMHPSVLSQLKYAINKCRRYGVETSICGQAGSNKDMVRFLVEQGIDSISANADSAAEISKLVQELEQKQAQEETEKQEKQKERTKGYYDKKTKEISGQGTEQRIREAGEPEKEADEAEKIEEETEEKKEHAEDISKPEREIEYGFDPFSDVRKPTKDEKIKEEAQEIEEEIEKLEEPETENNGGEIGNGGAEEDEGSGEQEIKSETIKEVTDLRESKEADEQEEGEEEQEQAESEENEAPEEKEQVLDIF